MFTVNIKRVLRSGFVNFWRNGYVSIASILVMTIALCVVGSLFFGRALLNSTLENIKNKVDINVYFTVNAPEDEILSLKKQIEAMPEVAEVQYSSAEQELVAFKARHENDELTLQAIEEIGSNPLGAALNIKAKNPSEYSGVAQFLESQNDASEASIIDKFNYNRNKVAIEALTKIIDSSRTLGIMVVGLFLIIAALISFNTIGLTIYMARDEISVMHLVGASPFFVKGPFIVAGVMYGFISTIFAILILAPIAYWAGPYTLSLGTGLNIWSHYLSNIFFLTFILFVFGFITGGLSSYLAVKKYLKV